MSKRSYIAVFCLALVTVVFGQESTLVATPSSEMINTLTDAQLGEQLKLLQNSLALNERHADNWWKTWTILYGAATIGQGAVALTTHQKSLRQDMIVGAGTTLLGVANQLLTPVTTDFRPIGTDSIAKLSFLEKTEKLAQGEEILKKQAQIAQAGKGWQVHALSGAVNLASGLITWIGFKRSFGEGVFNFALNTVITETQIWTQPIRAKKEYQQYLQAKSRGFATFQTNTPEWYGQVSPASCSFGIRF